MTEAPASFDLNKQHLSASQRKEIRLSPLIWQAAKLQSLLPNHNSRISTYHTYSIDDTLSLWQSQ